MRFQNLKVRLIREPIATGSANSGSAVPEEPNHFRRWGAESDSGCYEMMTAFAEDAIEADQRKRSNVPGRSGGSRHAGSLLLESLCVLNTHGQLDAPARAPVCSHDLTGPLGGTYVIT
jgi:hypothetical protein